MLEKKLSEPEPGDASRFLLFDAGLYWVVFDSADEAKTSGHHQDVPWSAVPEDAANLALKLDGAATELCAEFAGERSQTAVADLEADVCHAAFAGEHLTGTIHAEASQKLVWSFAKGGAEEAMEVKFRETGFACCLFEQDAGLVFGGQ